LFATPPTLTKLLLVKPTIDCQTVYMKASRPHPSLCSRPRRPVAASALGSARVGAVAHPLASDNGSLSVTAMTANFMPVTTMTTKITPMTTMTTNRYADDNDDNESICR
jgi:hypothetical protein